MKGRVIADRYELVRELGSGATAAVWLARDVRSGADLAVKVASGEVAGQAGTRERFLREAKLAAGLGGPHIARILDHGVTESGDLFLAMEYLMGANLADELAIRGRLSLDETAYVVSAVCDGLAIAHEAGVVHRDIKPQNIFLERGEGDESLGQVKIVDFGSAKAVDWLAESSVDPTRTGDLVGTPCYMSPEQAMGLKSIDSRTDFWAVGVVAFECMTGVRAFHAAALGPLMAKILTGPLPVPSAAASDIPPAVDAWMATLLARDPRARPASARAVATSLAAALDRRGEGARPPMTDKEARVRDCIAAGDVASAASLAIQDLGPQILHYLFGVLGDCDLADDAFSAFCERLLSALPRFEWRCTLRTWAYALARRSAADVRRKEGRHRRRMDPLTESRVGAIAENVRSATWPILRTVRRSALLELSDALPVEDRMLLVLRVDRGMPWQDIARVFLEKEAPADGDVHRESARLRKRFQLVRERLRGIARSKGLALDGFDTD